MEIEAFRDELVDTFGDMRNWNDFSEFTLEEIVNVIDSIASKYMY